MRKLCHLHEGVPVVRAYQRVGPPPGTDPCNSSCIADAGISTHPFAFLDMCLGRNGFERNSLSVCLIAYMTFIDCLLLQSPTRWSTLSMKRMCVPSTACAAWRL